MKNSGFPTFKLALGLLALCSVTATAQAYTLTANASTGGSVAKNPDLANYPPGTQVTITAVTNAGYIFASWWGDINATTNPLVITMNTNITVNANFALIAPIQNYTNRFDTASDATSWGVWWGPPNPTVSWDGATDAGGNPASGSLRVVEPFTGAPLEQFAVYGTLANRWPGDNGMVLNGTRYTNLVFDLKVDAGTRPTLNNDYGPLEPAFMTVDWNYVPLGTYHIPLSATNWTRIVQPINPTLPGVNRVTGIGFHIWSNGTFTNTLAFRVDNVTLQVTLTPNLNLSGNGGLSITNGDATPSLADGTDFGSALVGGGTVVRTFTIQNTGTVPLNLTGAPKVAVSGPQAAEFTVMQQPISPVASGGGTTTFQVTFAPAAFGPRAATLCITNDAPGQNPYSFAIQGTGSPFGFTTSGSTVTITGYAGPGGAVTIPGTINGLPVTSLGDYAFSGCGNLDSVTIPSSVTNIGSYTFASCTNLTDLTIGNGVISIGTGAFVGCLSLAEVTIPPLVTSIPNAAFANCENLSSVTIPNSVTNIGAGAFLYCNSLTSVIMLDGVINIGPFAFLYCNSLTSLAIPSSVTSIGSQAFSECRGLTDVTIPNGVTSIEFGTFEVCSSLTNVTIANGITNIGDRAFLGCSSLSGVAIPNRVTNIGRWAFEFCSSLTNITIPSSVTSIGGGAFAACASMTAITVDSLNPAYSSRDGVLFDRSQSILIQWPAGKTGDYTVPGTVAMIGDEAFYQGTSLTSVAIGNGVTNIGFAAFLGCTGLTNVMIGNHVSSIGYEAFQGCTSLTAITVDSTNPWYSSLAGVLFDKAQTTLIQCPGGIVGGYTVPSTVISIGNAAFCNCAQLITVTLGDGVTSIGYDAFRGCASLTSVTIPDSVTSIRDRAFCSCYSLTNVTIPNSVMNLGFGAFEDCTSLTEVTISSGITELEGYTFWDCFQLTGVYFQGNAPSLGPAVFDYVGGATVYYLPGTTGWGLTFAGLPTAFWCLPNPVILSDYPGFGARSNGFSFIISWATNLSVVVEACTNLANPTWSVVSTNTLISGSSVFCDSTWSNYPRRFYRLRSLPDLGAAQFNYQTNSGAITITGYTGPGGAVNIPSTINGLPVVGLGDWAFLGCASLISVTIPNSVTNLGDWVFMGCPNLASVMLGNGVSRIGDGTFWNCIGLTDVALPTSVRSIGDSAFCSCTGLTSVAIPNSVTSVGDWAFSECTRLTSVTIGTAVTDLGFGAFFGCTSLASVTIPGSVTSIGGRAFAGCTNMTAITVDALNAFYSSVNGVLFDKSQHAFIQYPAGWAGTSYTIPSGVTSIEASAFYGCLALTSVNIPPTVENIGDSAFYGCAGLTRVVIPPSVTSIEIQAFAHCAGLTNVTFASAPTSIGGRAFEGCTSLTSVAIPSTITAIESGAFAECTNLTVITVDSLNPLYSSVDGVLFDKTKAILIECPGGKAGSYAVPATVTSIADWAFDGCTRLTGITMPPLVSSIGYGALHGCIGLTSVTMPPLVTSVADETFWQCTGLTNVLIGNSVTTIEDRAFWGCASLASVTIPDSVISIGWHAFDQCTDLTSIRLGNDLTSIGEGAFAFCASLTNVTIPNSVTNLGGSAFSGCIRLADVMLGDSVTSIGDWAFLGCPSLTNITIPSSVISIGAIAFGFCSNLAGVYFLGNAPSVGAVDLFGGDTNALVYYLPGAAGWGPTFSGRPTALWLPHVQTTATTFGVRTNRFGFTIAWASGGVIVVEACTNLASPTWSPLQTNTLTGDSLDFSDSTWTNHARRFYRVRSP